MTTMFPAWRRRTWLVVLCLVLVGLVGANAHLVFVAFQYQGECVNDPSADYKTAQAAC